MKAAQAWLPLVSIRPWALEAVLIRGKNLTGVLIRE